MSVPTLEMGCIIWSAEALLPVAGNVCGRLTDRHMGRPLRFNY